jgi:hypothetical protein
MIAVKRPFSYVRAEGVEFESRRTVIGLAAFDLSAQQPKKVVVGVLIFSAPVGTHVVSPRWPASDCM